MNDDNVEVVTSRAPWWVWFLLGFFAAATLTGVVLLLPNWIAP